MGVPCTALPPTEGSLRRLGAVLHRHRARQYSFCPLSTLPLSILPYHNLTLNPTLKRRFTGPVSSLPATYLHGTARAPAYGIVNSVTATGGVQVLLTLSLVALTYPICDRKSVWPAQCLFR